MSQGQESEGIGEDETLPTKRKTKRAKPRPKTPAKRPRTRVNKKRKRPTLWDILHR